MRKYVLLVVVIVVLVLVVVTKLTSNSNVSYQNYSYKFVNSTLNLKLPKTVEVTENHIVDKDDVIFSIYFSDTTLGFWGYVQVWNIDDLKKFLTQSKSLSIFDYSHYDMNAAQVNKYSGFKTESTAVFGKKNISANEYWLKGNSPQVLRLSFFVDSTSFPKQLKPVIETIISSVQWDY